MKDFNKERFVAYAKYDLNANQIFYKNAGISIFMTTIGMMLFQVLTKWAIFKAVGTDFTPMDDGQPMPATVFIYMSSLILLASYLWAGSIGICIMAGSWAHGLRKKQGRIRVLTLPVSSLEKYLWHTGLMVVGGLAAMVCSIIVADLLNVLFTWAVTGIFDWRFSTLIALADGTDYILSIWNSEEAFSLGFITMLVLVEISCMVMQTALFVMSNSIMFKYNVIFTFVALSVVSGLLNTVWQITLYTLSNSDFDLLQYLNNISNTTQCITFYCTTAIAIIALLSLAAGIYYAGYKLFQKAQIYDKWNK